MSSFDRNQAWQAQTSATARIAEKGMRAYGKSLPNIGKAFWVNTLALHCIDGRTPGGFHLAGSGILLGIEGALRFAGEVKHLRHVQLEAIGWHRNCGAAAAYAKEHGGTADAQARRFAEELADQLSVEAVEVDSAPIGFHPERAVYYDNTGRFDWTRVKGLPTGFTISRAYLGFDVEYAKRELAIALGIALTPHNKGGHGFGEKFTAREPLLLVVVTNNRRELEKLTTEAREVVDALPSADQHRIHLDGFVWTQ